MLRSAASSGGRASGAPGSGMPGGERSARMSAWMRARRLSSRAAIAWWWGMWSWVPSTSCISRASWPQEASRRLSASAAVSSSARRTTGGARADLVPQRGRGVEEEDVDVAAGRERAQDVEVAGGEAREAEQREALGEVDERRVCAEPLAGGLEPLGGAGLGEASAQPPPQLRLPGRLGRHVDLAARPAADHRGAVERVAVEQLGEVADRGEAARAAVGVVLAAEVDGEAAQPRLVERFADDLEQGPDGALRRPGVEVGLDPGGGRDGVADEPVREREVDVRAHAVGAAGGGAEAGGHPLGQPALHAPRGHGDDVRRERVGQGVGEEPAERVDQRVRALSSVDVEHRSQGRPAAGHSDKNRVSILRRIASKLSQMRTHRRRELVRERRERTDSLVHLGRQRPQVGRAATREPRPAPPARSQASDRGTRARRRAP